MDVVDLTQTPPVDLTVNTKQDIPLDDNDRERTGRLTGLAFGTEVPTPATVSEKEDANNLAEDLYNQERQDVTLAAIHEGVTQGSLSAQGGLNLYAGRMGVPYSNPSEYNKGLVSYLASQAIDQYLAEKNQLTSEQKKFIAESADYNENVLIKRMLLEQIAHKYDTVPSKLSVSDFIPFAETYSANVNRKGLGSKSILQTGIDADNFRALQEAILSPSVSPEAFTSTVSKYLDGIEDPVQRSEAARRLLDPQTAEGSWGLLFDASSLAFGVSKVLGAASKGAVVASRAGESVIKGAVSSGSKALARETVDAVVPFGGEIVDGVGRAVKPRVAVKNMSTSPASMLKASGAENTAVQSVVKDLKSLKTGSTVDNELPVIMRQSTDSISMPTVEAMPSLSHKASLLNEQGLQEFERLLALSLKAHTGKIARLSKEAQDGYIEALKTDILNSTRTQYAQRFNDLLMWDRFSEDSDNLVLKTRMGTGLTGSEGFMSKEAAIKLRNGLREVEGLGDAIVDAKVSKIGDKYYVDTSLNLRVNEGVMGVDYVQSPVKGRIREQQSAAPTWIQGVFTLPFKSHFTRVLTGLKAQSDEAVDAVLSKFIDKHVKLNKKELTALDELSATSREKRKFFTPEELKDAGYGNKVIEAYGARRVLNDLDYMLENANLRERMTAAGYKRYNGVIGKLSKLSTLEDDVTLSFTYLDDIEGDSVLLSGREAKDKIKEGYIAVRPLAQEGVDFYLVQGSNLIEERLPFTVLNYVPGGRAWYSDDLTYIKQLRTNETGKLIKGVNTLLADMDASKATRFAEDLEDLRTRYIAGRLTDEYVQAKNPVLLPFSSVNELVEYFKDNNINLLPSARIEAVKDGKPLASYASGVGEGFFKEVEEGHLQDVSFLSGYHLQAHALKLQAKHRYDKQLVNLLGEDLDRVSFKEEMKRLQSAIVSAGETDMYTKMYADEFYNQYKDVLYNGDHLSPIDALLYGQFKPETGALRDKVVSGKNMQLNYRAVLHTPTDFDKAVDDIISKTFTSITKESFESSKNVSNLYEGLKKLKPLSKFRQYTYHFLMGCFSTPQFVRQFSQVLNSAALASPTALPKAIKLFLPSLGIIATGADPSNIKVAARNLAVIDPSIKVNDAEAIFEALHQLPWAQGLQGGMNIDKVGLTKLGRLSAGFALAGEQGARVFNNLLALSEAGINSSRRWGDLTEVQKAEVLNRANNLYLNMNSTGLSRVQASGIGATMVQMLTFNLRFIDMLLDPEITKGAKARLAATLFVTTGLNGMLSPVGLGGLGYMTYNTLVDEPSEDSDLVYKSVMNGVLNVFLNETTGKDYDWFKGNGVQILETLYTADSIRDFKVPMFTVANKSYNAVADVFRALNWYAQDEISPDEFKDMLSTVAIEGNLPSGVNRLLRAYHIYQYGELINSKGGLTDTERTKIDALMYLAGFDNRTTTNNFIAKRALQDSYEARREAIKELKPLCLEAARRGNWKLISHYISLYTKDLTVEDRVAIMNTVYKDIGTATQTDRDKIALQVMRSRISAEAKKQIIEQYKLAQ